MDLGKPLVDYGPIDARDLIAQTKAQPPEFWTLDRESRVSLAGNRPGNAVFLYNDKPYFVKRNTVAESLTGTISVLKYIQRPLFDVVDDLIAREIRPRFPDCETMRVQLAELPPGEVIKPHYDRNILAIIHRLHVPLITHPLVNFMIQDQNFHLAAGRLYDLNNAVIHAVANNSDVMRIHLLVDMLPRFVARTHYCLTEQEMVEADKKVMQA